MLAHNHDVLFATLTDDRDVVIASTRRAWLARPIEDVFPQLWESGATTAESRAGMTIVSTGGELLGRADLLVGTDRDTLRPTRTGNVVLAYDLERYKAEARAQVVQQSLYWAGWVTALALAMWLVFHFLLTRRTARLVHAAEELASGNLAARSDLGGKDELGRLGRSFDAMALVVADTQIRLRHDIEERVQVQKELEASEASYRSIFDAAEDSIFVHDPDSGAIVDVNPKACATFGYTRDEFRHLTIGELGTGERPYTQQDAMELIGRASAGEQLRIEWHGRCKDGTLRWHEVFVKRAVIGGKDRILALRATSIEKKRSEEEISRAARIALPAREDGGAGLAAGRCRARAQQSAVGRGRARGAARGTGRIRARRPRRRRSAPPPSAARASSARSSPWRGSSSRSADRSRSTTSSRRRWTSPATRCARAAST